MALTLPVDNFVQGGVTTTDEVFACAPPNIVTAPLFWKLNKNLGTIISTQNITSSSGSVLGCTSLATDPLTNTIFGFIELNGTQNNSRLATINQIDATAIIVASLGDRYVGLTFLENGDMRAVSSFNHPDTGGFLYSIDKITFATTQLCQLPPASVGLALAINWDNSTLYHAEGNLGFGGKIASIDSESSPTCATTQSLYTGANMDEIRGFSYNTNDSIFYYGGSTFTAPTTAGFGTITTAGVSTQISDPFPLNPRGMTFLLNPAQVGSGTPLTAGEQQEIDTFENARNIGFTVVGILPVALFFALFSIFSGRIE